MNKLLVTVPTRGRYEKLMNMLKSIPNDDERVSALVICDDDPGMADLVAQTAPLDRMDVVCTPEHLGSVACRNCFTHYVEDGMLYATDDIVFAEGAFDEIFTEFNLGFGDDDGVLGVTQQEEHDPAGVAVLGLPFLERYPGRTFLYPRYFHFAATEVRYLAERLGRFRFTNRALVQHSHPAFYPEALDETHKEARRFTHPDHKLKREREKAGLIWRLNG